MAGTGTVSRLDELFGAGLLVPSGVDGLYGTGAEFEAVVSGVSRLVAAAAADLEPVLRRFPPVVPTATFERSGYLRSFPDLLGAVRSFGGDERAHARLLGAAAEGADWGGELEAAGAVLCAAACHPLYPTLPAVAPPGGARYDVCGWVYRHEPSTDPARQQSFRQHEIVYVGDRAGAVAHRDLWRDRGRQLLTGLGLEVDVEVAHDPFFGRAGRLLSSSQVEAALKYELLAATSGSAAATAVASTNCHEDHFGEAFGLRDAGGATAHSACVGFGLERVTLALLWAHGLDTGLWPAPVRSALGLGGAR